MRRWNNILGGLIVLLGIADAGLTTRIIRQPGGQELNPIWSCLLPVTGLAGFVVAKFLIHIGLVGFILWKGRPHPRFVRACFLLTVGWYGSVVVQQVLLIVQYHL